MRAARRSRPSCSRSTNSATRARSATAPCRRRSIDKAYLAKANCPELAIDGRGERMSARPPVNDWATDFDHLDPRWIEDPYPIWDALRAALPDRPYRALSRRLFPVALRGRARGRLRHRAFFLAPHHRARRRRRRAFRRRRSPPIRRSIGRRRTLLLPAFTPDAIKRHEPRARDICSAADRPLRRQGRLRCGGRLRAGNPGARDRRTCSACPKTRATASARWIHEILEARHHRAGRADAGDRRDRRAISTPRSRSAAPRRATT